MTHTQFNLRAEGPLHPSIPHVSFIVLHTLFLQQCQIFLLKCPDLIPREASAKGAASYQPGATPQGFMTHTQFNLRAEGPLHPSIPHVSFIVLHTLFLQQCQIFLLKCPDLIPRESSAKGAAPYQPGATPQGFMTHTQFNPDSLRIWNCAPQSRDKSRWGGLTALCFLVRLLPWGVAPGWYGTRLRRVSS